MQRMLHAATREKKSGKRLATCWKCIIFATGKSATETFQINYYNSMDDFSLHTQWPAATLKSGIRKIGIKRLKYRKCKAKIVHSSIRFREIMSTRSLTNLKGKWHENGSSRSYNCQLNHSCIYKHGKFALQQIKTLIATFQKSR